MSIQESINRPKSSFISLIVQILFPVQKKDMKKVVILFFLFFFVSFIYNILQPLKKTIIMYTPGAGTEAVPYLKALAIAPGSILFTWLFLSLSSRFDRNTVFRVVVLTFSAYFVLYTFLLNPFKEYFALDSCADMLLRVLPKNFHAAPALIRYWMDTVFYAFAELWGTTVLSLLLWGLVNEISSHEDAKATYALFTVGANSSGIFAGKLSSYLTMLPYNQTFFYGSTQWDQSFLRIMLVVIGLCCWILMMYRYFSSQGYTAKLSNTIANPVVTGHKKNSVLDCFSEVLRSKNLLCITIIVMGYNLVYNLSDVVFNKSVELSFGPENKVASNAFMSQVQMYTGIVSTTLALVVSNLSLRYFGWTATAAITPVAYLLSGIFFYTAQIDACVHYLNYLPFDPGTMALYAGGMHICLTRGSKYSVFDSTKEMAYIGLSREERVNGKAAIDGIASRFGKTGGSFVLFFLFGILGNNITFTIPYVFVIVTITTVIWLFAVKNLGQRYHAMHHGGQLTMKLD